MARVGGETEASVSGWTVDTLAIHMQRQHDDFRLSLAERYATQTKAVDAAFQAQQTAMQTAFTAADKAVDQRANTLDREFHEHLEQVRHENALAFLNSDKAVQAALAAQDRAVQKAEASVDRRLESMNEFRQQLADQAATFISKAESSALLAAMAERLSRLEERMNQNAGHDVGVSAATETRMASNRQGMMIITAVTAVIAIAVTLILGLNN